MSVAGKYNQLVNFYTPQSTTLVVDLHIEKLHSIQANAFVHFIKTPFDSNAGLFLDYDWNAIWP